MADIYTIQKTTLTNIADAIREKTGKSDMINPLDMDEEILSIETGGGGPDNIMDALSEFGDTSSFYSYESGDWNETQRGSYNTVMPLNMNDSTYQFSEPYYENQVLSVELPIMVPDNSDGAEVYKNLDIDMYSTLHHPSLLNDVAAEAGSDGASLANFLQHVDDDIVEDFINERFDDEDLYNIACNGIEKKYMFYEIESADVGVIPGFEDKGDIITFHNLSYSAPFIAKDSSNNPRVYDELTMTIDHLKTSLEYSGYWLTKGDVDTAIIHWKSEEYEISYSYSNGYISLSGETIASGYGSPATEIDLYYNAYLNINRLIYDSSFVQDVCDQIEYSQLSEYFSPVSLYYAAEEGLDQESEYFIDGVSSVDGNTITFNTPTFCTRNQGSGTPTSYGSLCIDVQRLADELANYGFNLTRIL